MEWELSGKKKKHLATTGYRPVVARCFFYVFAAFGMIITPPLHTTAFERYLDSTTANMLAFIHITNPKLEV